MTWSASLLTGMVTLEQAGLAWLRLRSASVLVQKVLDIGPSEAAVDPDKIGTGLKVRTGHSRLEAGEGEASSPEPMDEGSEQHAGMARVLLQAQTYIRDNMP